RGNVLQEINRFEEALADHEQALALNPRLVSAQVNRGNVLRNLKRLPEAIGSYDQAIALAPSLVVPHRNPAAVLKELGRLPAALAGYETAIALDPTDMTELSEALFLQARMCSWNDAGRGADLLRRIGEGAIVPPFHLFSLADDPALQLANARG